MRVLAPSGAQVARECAFSLTPPRGGGELSQFTVTTILMASGGLLIANSNASAARASGKWCENTWARAARQAATEHALAMLTEAAAALEPGGSEDR